MSKSKAEQIASTLAGYSDGRYQHVIDQLFGPQGEEIVVDDFTGPQGEPLPKPHYGPQGEPR
jgi:hypothetical protein